MLAGEQSEPAGSRQETESAEGESEVGSKREFELDLDEEPTEEVEKRLATSNGGRRFLDEEHVLLTDEGEPKSFEKAKRDIDNRK